jgi:hypothetical protein
MVRTGRVAMDRGSVVDAVREETVEVDHPAGVSFSV